MALQESLSIGLGLDVEVVDVNVWSAGLIRDAERRLMQASEANNSIS